MLAPLPMQRADMGQAAALRVLDVLQEAPGGADSCERILGIEARKIARAELLAEQPLAGARIEMPRRPLAYAGGGLEPARRRRVLGDQ